MIKTAQDAYLAGRQAAMEKLATKQQVAAEGGVMDSLKALGGNQIEILKQIGLSGKGLYDSPEQGAGVLAHLDPRRLASMQNLSRLGMLGGAAGGAYLGGMDPRAAAIASAGALGGAAVGGNLGQGIGAAINTFTGENGELSTLQDVGLNRLIAGGGALGGLGGGLAAGKYLS
jgi:hypothetical protein